MAGNLKRSGKLRAKAKRQLGPRLMMNPAGPQTNKRPNVKKEVAAQRKEGLSLSIYEAGWLPGN